MWFAKAVSGNIRVGVVRSVLAGNIQDVVGILLHEESHWLGDRILGCRFQGALILILPLVLHGHIVVPAMVKAKRLSCGDTSLGYHDLMYVKVT